MRIKVATVFGTRPEIIKLSPIIPLFDQYFDHIVIHTGQHYSHHMDKIFFEQINLRDPDYLLNIGSGPQARQTGLMMTEIEKIFLDEKPALIVVQGDTNSTLAGALVAAKLAILLAHIEAGSRSFNRKMPEEINRIVTDQISDFLFANDDHCKKNLLLEGISDSKINVVGNTFIDALDVNSKYSSNKILEQFLLERQGYVTITMHRAETTNDGSVLANVIKGINNVSKKIKIVFPIHPRTKKMILRAGLKLSPEIKVCEPVGYLEMISLLKNSLYVMTDSGGVVRECVALNVPCLVLRNEIEAMDILNTGKIKLTTTSKERIIQLNDELVGNHAEIKRMKDLPYNVKRGVSLRIAKNIFEKMSKNNSP